jgi:vacuolar-type H+-ATPase catalytic subunit A/Vma1
MTQTFRQDSRIDWTPTSQPISKEQLAVGCLQRIADAAEKMVANYDAMRKKAERYERWYKEEWARCTHRDRQISALHGQITKLKKAMDGAKAR